LFQRYGSNLLLSFVLRWSEVETYQTKTGQTLISLLVENFPEAAEVALNQCVHHSPHLNTTDPEYTDTYDFKYLDPGPEVKDSSKRFSTVKTMIKHQRVRLLLHPLTLKFNERKWSTLGKFGFFIDFVTYFTLLIFLSIFALWEYSEVTEFGPLDNNTSEETKVYYEENVTGFQTIQNLTFGQSKDFTSATSYTVNYTFMTSVIGICGVFLILHVCKEFFQIYMQRWRYFKDTSIYLRWIFYLSITGTMMRNDVTFWAMAIFVCYSNMMLFLRRYRLFGTYILMYTEVIKTVIQVMVVFVYLIMGFALVFYILFKEQVKVIVKVF